MNVRSLGTAERVFTALCAASLLVCIAYRDWSDAVQCVATAAVAWPLYRLTVRFTNEPARSSAPKNVVAAGIVMAVILVLTAAELAGVVTRATDLWGQVHWGLARLIARAIGVQDLETVNSAVTLAVIPLAIVIALGWRLSDAGAGRSGKGTLKTLVLWSSVPIAVYAVFIVLGRTTVAAVAQRTLVDVFRNGFAEEIFFRGILLRIATSAGLKTGNVVQALCFGLLHYGSNLRDVHGVPVLALADGICTQALFGYVVGLITLRTRNVLVAGTFHSLLDAARVIS